MILTRYTHACVRLESGDRSLVIDPGVYAEDAAFDGSADILITHEHADHVDAERLAGKGFTIYAPAAVAEQLSANGVTAHAVEVGSVFTVAGFSVLAVGGRHAEVFGGTPDCANIGYVVDENVYHPGDAYFVPFVPLQTLLLPVAAPWAKLSEAIVFAREVAPVRAFPIHDATLSEIGQGMADGWLDHAGNTDYRRIPVGESVEI